MNRLVQNFGKRSVALVDTWITKTGRTLTRLNVGLVVETPFGEVL
jgi:hypothetical protein